MLGLVGPPSRGAVPCEAKGVETDQAEELLGSKVSFCLFDKTSSGTCYRYKKYFKNDKAHIWTLKHTHYTHTENRSVVACGMGVSKIGERGQQGPTSSYVMVRGCPAWGLYLILPRVFENCLGSRS